MQSQSTYIRIVDNINKVTIKIIALLSFAIFVSLVLQVFFRFVVNASLSWSEEVARYLTIWMVFLGVSIGVRRQSLIAVEVVVQSVRPRVRRVFRLVVAILTIIFSVYLIVYGGMLVTEADTEISIALQMPMWIAYFALLAGGVLSLMNAIAVMIETVAAKGVK